MPSGARAVLPLLLALSLLSPAPALSQAVASPRLAEQQGERAAMDAAVRDLCGRQVVMLGENGFHGDGRTVAFKAALVQRLVNECHFNAVYFEASHYDFIEISRRLRASEAVPADMLASAIGRVWSQDTEMAPLIGFLQAEATAGRVSLGGLDDQLGSRGAFYSLERMPAELAESLSGPRREDCQRRLRQRIWYDYPGEAPYSEADRAEMRKCLTEIGYALVSGGSEPRERDERLEMIANFERCIGRDFMEGSIRPADRDHSMYLNLQWLMARRPAGAKAIIWAANGHVSKAPRPEFGGRNLGSYVAEAYGGRAFSLGFSAASGSYRYDTRTARDIPAALPGSFEALALAPGSPDTGYVGASRLRKLDAMPGAAFDDHKLTTARWGDFYDGVVVFKAERPPRRLDE